MTNEQKHRNLMDLPLEERLKILGMDKPPTAEEIKRRKQVGKEVDSLREEIGPIDMKIHDLLELTDEELDEKYGRERPKRS